MSAWLVVFLIITGGLFVGKLLFAISAGLSLPVTKGALFVSTPRSTIKTLLDDVPMTENALFVDLGCGDGRVLKAVRKCFHVRAIGFEINPLAWILAKILNIFDSGVTIKRDNFWHYDLSEASVVFCYLFPDVMGRLGVKLKAELGPGAVVISCNFPLPGWNASKVISAEAGSQGDPVFIYQIKSE
jgi:hypothetical protein